MRPAVREIGERADTAMLKRSHRGGDAQRGLKTIMSLIREENHCEEKLLETCACQGTQKEISIVTRADDWRRRPKMIAAKQLKQQCTGFWRIKDWRQQRRPGSCILFHWLEGS